MDKPTGPHGMYLAPGAPASARALRCPGDDAGAMQLPGEGHSWPRVDDHVVEPGTGTEMIDGVIVEVAPVGRAHSGTQVTLIALLRALVTDAYEVMTELLTRTSKGWNFAADVCILRRGVDPVSGGRHLEEVVFEVCDSQRMSDLTRRAQQLSDRGVRRIFAIHARLEDPDQDASAIVAGPVEEWSAAARSWTKLEPDGAITDPTLRRPIEVRAFLDAAEASRELARTLLAQRHPVLVEHEQTVKAEGKSEGKAEGLLAAIETVCSVFDIVITGERRAHLESLDAGPLADVHAQLLAQRRWVD